MSDSSDVICCSEFVSVRELIRDMANRRPVLTAGGRREAEMATPTPPAWLPPRTARATPTPLGTAMKTPTTRQLQPVRPSISVVGQLGEETARRFRDLQVRSGQVRSGQVRSGQVRSELWRDLSPVELQYEQTTKEEADQHTDGEGVQLSLQTDPDELLVLDGQTEDDGQDGPHQRRDQHTGYQLDRGVLHQAWTAQCQTKKYLF